MAGGNYQNAINMALKWRIDARGVFIFGYAKETMDTVSVAAEHV